MNKKLTCFHSPKQEQVSLKKRKKILMSVILSNDKPSVNYTITRTTSIFDMIKNLITVFSATPKLQPVYVAQYSEEYLDYSLKIGHLPEYSNSCPHRNVKNMGNGWYWCTDCGERWKK